MSLNHLLDGGAAPPQDVRVNDIYVEGNIIGSQNTAILPYNFKADSGLANATVVNGPGGTGAGVTGNTRLAYTRVSGVHQAHFRTDFQTGTGSKNLLLTIDMTELGLSSPENLILVANSVHQTGAGPWEQLFVGVYTFQSPTEIVVDLVRPDDTPFPANKQYSVNISFSFADA